MMPASRIEHSGFFELSDLHQCCKDQPTCSIDSSQACASVHSSIRYVPLESTITSPLPAKPM